MPTTDHLQLDQTFEAQRDLVNRIIVLTIMEALDLVTYPVAETIIYDMIHNRHKHRREKHLIKQRSVSFQDTQNRRKHMNSQHSGHTLYHLTYHLIGDYHIDFEGWKKAINF